MKSLFNFTGFIKDDSALEVAFSEKTKQPVSCYAQMRPDDKKLNSICRAIFPPSAMTYVC